MDEKSLLLLEFPAIRERLAGLTAFAPGRRLAESIGPSDDPVLVARGLDETDQTRALLEELSSVGVGAAHDIGPWIERASRGGRLDPGQFLEIAETLDAVGRLGTALADERRPLLRELGRELHPLPAVRAKFRLSISETNTTLCARNPRFTRSRYCRTVLADSARWMAPGVRPMHPAHAAGAVSVQISPCRKRVCVRQSLPWSWRV